MDRSYSLTLVLVCMALLAWLLRPRPFVRVRGAEGDTFKALHVGDEVYLRSTPPALHGPDHWYQAARGIIDEITTGEMVIVSFPEGNRMIKPGGFISVAASELSWRCLNPGHLMRIKQ